MWKFLLPVALALGMVATLAMPAGAITGGQPDGDGHPYECAAARPRASPSARAR